MLLLLLSKVTLNLFNFDMKESSADQLKYLSINSQDEDWGIVVTTVGYQFIPPEGQYPQSSPSGVVQFQTSDRQNIK